MLMKFLYLLAILPPPDVSLKIDTIRKECAEKFGVVKALRPPVHITLYKPVWMEESREPELKAQLKEITTDRTPFRQKVRNFGKFGKNVVYINAINNPGLDQLHNVIWKTIRQMNLDPKSPDLPTSFHPHFTIAYRDVSPELFEQIWSFYQQQVFEADFIADRFSVLKHDGKKWNLLGDFPFIKE